MNYRLLSRSLTVLALTSALVLAALPAILFAAPPAQDAGDALVFQSDTLPSASSPGRVITLTLASDDSASMSTDFLDGDAPVVEVGDWSADDVEQTVTVTLTGTDSSLYEAPTTLVFAVEDDGSIATVEWDEMLYGSEGLTLFPVTDEGASTGDEGLAADESSAAGVYVSSILPAASSAGQVVLMILYEDGSIQASTFYLDNAAPILEEGSWAELDASVTVTVTGTTDEEYDTPQALTFERDGDTLSYLSLTLSRLPEAGLTAAPAPIAWYQSDIVPAASSPGLQQSLILYDDNSVQMVSDYQNDEPPIVEVGAWEEGDDGAITVSLTGRPERAYDNPDVIVFAAEDGELVATEWDQVVYGSGGLTLAEQPLEELTFPAVESPATGEVSASAALTETETIAGTESVSETDGITETESVTETTIAADAAEGGADDAAQAAPFEPPFGATVVYVSDLLPAADTPGRIMRLVLFDDGSAQMVTDYLNDESPVIELGEWEDNGDETLTVSLLGQIEGPYDNPVIITFARTAEGVSAVAWDEMVYGSAGIEMTTEYAADEGAD